MKTTIDIPEALYKKAKIRAVEKGQTFKALVMASLEHELEKGPKVVKESAASYWVTRKRLPEYDAAMKSGAFDCLLFPASYGQIERIAQTALRETQYRDGFACRTAA